MMSAPRRSEREESPQLKLFIRKVPKKSTKEREKIRKLKKAVLIGCLLRFIFAMLNRLKLFCFIDTLNFLKIEGDYNERRGFDQLEEFYKCPKI